MLNSIFDLIDTRSFGSLWYWIAMAVSWTMATQRVVGVPWDVVVRARRRGPEAGTALIVMAGSEAARIVAFWRESGVGRTVALSCAVTLLVVLGFGYGFELLQALALILVPIIGTGLMGLRTARRIEAMLAGGADVGAVIQTLSLHRFFVQLVALGAIVIASFWGMSHNIRPYL